MLIAKTCDKLSCFVKKDRTKKLDNVNLVYNIPCATCKLSYVGEMKRAFSYRFDEHKKSVENTYIDKVIAKHINNSHKYKMNELK